MDQQLLNIKITLPPLRQGLISRPHLSKQIEQNLFVPDGFSRQLTLISAPAGFGKTTFILQWLKQRKEKVAWYALDAQDNDFNCFWMYMICALQTVKKDLGHAALQMLRSLSLTPPSAATSSSFLTSFLNDLMTLKTPVFLILDDYHLISNKQIHEILAFFIDNMPPTLHLILITRADPPLPLGLWRAKFQMLEIRQYQLQFTENEASCFLQQMINDTPDNTVLCALMKKTEGWITGLQLAALSLQNQPDKDLFMRSFTGTHRHVLHFLTEEVLSNQSETVQRFLLETSILDRLSPSLCNAITERDDSFEMLNYLEQNNLFILPLSLNEQWYRYHALFSDLLRFHLKNKFPEKISSLHQKASNWFESEGDLAMAIEHAFVANKLERVGYLLSEHRDVLWQQHGLDRVMQWLDGLPLAIFEKFPLLIVSKAFFHLIKDSRKEAAHYISLLENKTYTDEKQQKEFEGMVALIEAYIAVFDNQFEKVLLKTQKALTLLPAKADSFKFGMSLICGDVHSLSGQNQKAIDSYFKALLSSKKTKNYFFTLLAGLKIGHLYWYQGRLLEGQKLCKDLLAFSKEQGLTAMPRTGSIWSLYALFLNEKNERDKAYECIEKGLSLCETEKPILGWSYLCQIHVCFSRQEYDLALAAITHILSISQSEQLPVLMTCLASFWKARILLAQNAKMQAKAHLGEMGIHVDGKINFLQETGYLILVRILLEEQDVQAAENLLARINTSVDTQALKNVHIQALLLKARILEKQSKPKQAVNTFEKALQIGISEGFCRIFIDEGEVLIPLLTKISSSSDVGDYATTLLKHFFTTTRYTKPEKPVQPLIDPLSTRELEILQHISKGLSNQEIADTLFLSVGTIKWHASNIYGKLGVEKRTQAIARAQQLNIL